VSMLDLVQNFGLVQMIEFGHVATSLSVLHRQTMIVVVLQRHPSLLMLQTLRAKSNAAGCGVVPIVGQRNANQDCFLAHLPHNGGQPSKGTIADVDSIADLMERHVETAADAVAGSYSSRWSWWGAALVSLDQAHTIVIVTTHELYPNVALENLSDLSFFNALPTNCKPVKLLKLIRRENDFFESLSAMIFKKMTRLKDTKQILRI
jgi:hypothetical protein